MTHVIAVTNRKGGVGKSTVSTHLAAGLATRGYQVAIVDTDSQGHAALMLGMPDENGLYNVMIDKQPMEAALRLVPQEQYSTPDDPARGNLWLLPSSDKTFQIPDRLEPDETFLFVALMDALGEGLNLDYIIIDTNPTLSLLDGAIWMAVDGYLYVTECSRLSFDGVNRAIEQLQRFSAQRKKFLHRDSRVLGIIPNKMRMDTKLHRYNVEKLGEGYPGLVWTPMRLRIAWEEATNNQELMYTYSPGGQEADDAWAIVTRAIREMERA
jgi:chromosome partitioning protein